MIHHWKLENRNKRRGPGFTRGNLDFHLDQSMEEETVQGVWTKRKEEPRKTRSRRPMVKRSRSGIGIQRRIVTGSGRFSFEESSRSYSLLGDLKPRSSIERTDSWFIKKEPESHPSGSWQPDEEYYRPYYWPLPILLFPKVRFLNPMVPPYNGRVPTDPSNVSVSYIFTGSPTKPVCF